MTPIRKINFSAQKYFRRIVFSFLLGLLVTFSSLAAPTNNPTTNTRTVSDATNRLGSWIWADKTYSQQLCRFWKSFDLPAQKQVVRARLFITADNAFRVFLNGREIGRGSEWRRLTEYDLSWVLVPGRQILAVECFNDYAEAGLILGLRVEFANGEIMDVVTDETWRVVPNDERDWEKKSRPLPTWPRATVAGAMGEGPWWKQNPTATTVPPVMPIYLRFWQTGWFQITMLSICGTVLLICLRLMAKITSQSKEQKLLQRERARIARDIHDDLGASLTQLVLLGEMAQNDLPANSGTRTQIDGLCEKAREVLRSMEEVIWMVNSRRDTLSDFATYVCKYAQNFLHSSPIRCRLEIEPELPAIPFDLPIRRNLFLAVKEAINNAAKYSEAKELFLRIHRRGQNIEVIVEDNGKGFDPALADLDRNGLTNMKQRMKEVDGICRLTSQPGTGCRVEFVTPLAHFQPQRSRWWHWRKRDKTIVVEKQLSPDAASPLVNS